MKRLRSADEEVLVLWLMRRRTLPYREQILIPDFRLDFRFTVWELTLLIHYLRPPKVIYTHEGVRSNAIEALAICLRRQLYSVRWIDMAGMFGRAPSTLCHIFYYIVEFLDEKLTDLLYFDKTRITNNMERYCAAIASKAPDSIQRVWEFIDGTIRPICRPSKGQQAMFNGHKRVHAVKFQTVVTPDGLISRPVDGRSFAGTPGAVVHNEHKQDRDYDWDKGNYTVQAKAYCDQNVM
ncbi:Hypothetical protein PHPALM_6003 [Phytophthora palmivora]|uniref:DDE Tnp4 domain-containing protein n=1 Tax=Phytophthora palmivora TaxID=4796 RepID=A0A2P4YFX2_9STRA|nr:Hypothetical protein PHPALM_6003 [Phytophthora palmivora]